MNNDNLKVRTRKLNECKLGRGPIVYWMNRDQRLVDNWALVAADTLAREQSRQLIVVFVMFETFMSLSFDAISPIYQRLGQGLNHVIALAIDSGIDFTILHGDPQLQITRFIKEKDAGALIVDFSPLREMRLLRENVAEDIDIMMLEVDAHNIIPPWVASVKQEWGAYTIRPKIKRLLPLFLEEIPQISSSHKGNITIDDKFRCWLENLPPLMSPRAAMDDFIDNRLMNYHFRNNPNIDATSRLSSYLHFGNLSASRLAMRVQESQHPSEEFLEEMIVRRELAENYCYYNQSYDSFAGFPDWARKTLDKHRGDRREYTYDLLKLETAKTHDPVWNAAQLQLVKTNYMHGYLRMYWAKKILEWTPDPETALKYAIQLNDKYQLDGRDPNGYTGIAWAIGGVHDRPWGERKIFGMIRYMNNSGLKSKFGVEEYVRTWNDDEISLL